MRLTSGRIWGCVIGGFVLALISPHAPAPDRAGFIENLVGSFVGGFLFCMLAVGLFNIVIHKRKKEV